MQGLLFWMAFGVLLPQALWTRQATPRFRAPSGETHGLITPAHTVDNSAPLEFVGLGDSIIAGVGAKTMTETLVVQAARALSGHLNRPIQWRALGKIGANGEQIEARAHQMDWPQSADVVLISTGVNDLLGLVTVDTWQKRVQRLVETVRDKAPNAWIVFCGLPPMQIFPALPWPLSHVLGFRARQLDLALVQATAPFERVLSIKIYDQVSRTFMAADGFHPGPKGYQVFGALVADALSAKWHSV